MAGVAPGHARPLHDVLSAMREDPGHNAVLPFGKVDGVHFARLVLLDTSEAQDGAEFPARLLLLLDCDAPRGRRLGALVRAAGAGVDRVFEHCEGYPPEGMRSDRTRLAYLRSHMIKADVAYVNTAGRPLRQVRQEEALRAAIEDFLDEPGHQWSTMTGREVRAAIQSFAANRPDLHWALQPAGGPGLRWRAREWAHLVGSLLLIALAFPFAVMVAPLAAILLRWHEKRDAAPRVIPDDDHVRRLADDEDHCAQNQFTAVGELKPGWFRRVTAIVVLWLVGLGVRHLYNRGTLTGVRTIHFARWVFIDDRRRLVFASNYDGSLESYMDDFINKVSWGLNAVFSNGLEYPRTNWLVRDGATDELAFKSYIRTRQVPSQVWYTAYGNLTADNIAKNARLRAGLSGELDDDALAAWLRLL